MSGSFFRRPSGAGGSAQAPRRQRRMNERKFLSPTVGHRSSAQAPRRQRRMNERKFLSPTVGRRRLCAGAPTAKKKEGADVSFADRRAADARGRGPGAQEEEGAG